MGSVLVKAKSCGEVQGDRAKCGCQHLGLDCHYDAVDRQRIKSECIKHGYAEYIDGEFRLKEKGE